MSSEKTVKAVVSVLLLTFIDIVLTYGVQCVILAAVNDRAKAGAAVALLLLAGVPAVLLQIAFAIMSTKLAWFETKEICLIVAVNMALYAVLMFLAFDHIPVAYSLVPVAEMGIGFLQLFIKIFACAEAAVCLIASLIIMAVKGSEKTY